MAIQFKTQKSSDDDPDLKPWATTENEVTVQKGTLFEEKIELINERNRMKEFVLYNSISVRAL